MNVSLTGLPICFFHRLEPSPYLIASVLQARFTNPNSPIILFHDFSEIPPDLLAHNITCIPFSEYYGECGKLDELWFNISRNRSECELGSIQRWMVLRNYLRSENVSRCFSADSDLLIYCNITEAQKNFQTVDCTLADQAWSSLFLNNIAVLNVFHDFILEAFRRTSDVWWKILEAINIFNTREPIGNLADTVLIKLFINEYAASHGFRWQNTNEIVNGSVFCPDLRSSSLPFEMEPESQDPFDARPLRKTFWQNGLPHARLRENGNLIRLNVLHFRGFLKHTHLVPCFSNFLEFLKTQEEAARVLK